MKDVIFDGNILKFERNNEKINENIFCRIVKDKMIHSSLILPNEGQNEDLKYLCDFPIDQKCNLIYRASRDGFEAFNFNAKCDNKPNTLVIIKSTNGNVFGGYTEQSCSSEVYYKDDRNSFIFSLINKLNKPIKIKMVSK